MSFSSRRARQKFAIVEEKAGIFLGKEGARVCSFI